MLTEERGLCAAKYKERGERGQNWGCLRQFPKLGLVHSSWSLWKEDHWVLEYGLGFPVNRKWTSTGDRSKIVFSLGAEYIGVSMSSSFHEVQDICNPKEQHGKELSQVTSRADELMRHTPMKWAWEEIHKGIHEGMWETMGDDKIK
jgi:hypothetical protein